MAGLITVAVIWLHFFFLIHAGGLWRDEVNLVNLAGRHSLGDMAKDSFPLLMPLIVRGWSVMGPGHSEAGLRLLGGLIGMGIIAALWAAAWTARRSPPLLGLVLLALNSTFMVYGDSLRAYGLGSLLIVLTARAACAFLQRSSPARAGWLALFAVLSVQALYPNAILVGAICAGSWAVCMRRKTWREAVLILGAGVAAAASLLPYLPTIVAGRSVTDVMRTGLKITHALGNLAGRHRFSGGTIHLHLGAAGTGGHRRWLRGVVSQGRNTRRKPARGDDERYALVRRSNGIRRIRRICRLSLVCGVADATVVFSSAHGFGGDVF